MFQLTAQLDIKCTALIFCYYFSQTLLQAGRGLQPRPERFDTAAISNHARNLDTPLPGFLTLRYTVMERQWANLKSAVTLKHWNVEHKQHARLQPS